MYSTNQDSFEQRDNKFSTRPLTDATKEINRIKIIKVSKNFLNGDNGYQNKVVYLHMYQFFCSRTKQ